MSKFDNTDKGSYYKRKTNYRNIQSAYPGQSYFCDWVVFNKDSTRANYNNKYILTVVDAYSRYLFMRISKTNNAQDYGTKKNFPFIRKRHHSGQLAITSHIHSPSFPSLFYHTLLV